MKDEILAGDKWVFDESVTQAFDDMLSRSIPGFIDMRKLVTDLACKFAIPKTTIVDLGCSSGGALLPIVQHLGSQNRYLGLEISEPMREAAKNRFINFKNIDISIENVDLREEYPKEKSSVVLSVLTLQFIPIEYRQRVLANAYASMENNSAFILVEKILGRNTFLNELFVELYYNLKGTNGYTEAQINSKRKSLEGVLVPVTSDWNEDLLLNAGFKNVECFWRNLNFAGWVGVKIEK
ncbi:MAG: Erwinia phage vB EamM [Actinomycetota bacterium]|jgi:tRNA (cmo5U34)-methyltransferase